VHAKSGTVQLSITWPLQISSTRGLQLLDKENEMTARDITK
jgi:hypothetical protein